MKTDVQQSAAYYEGFQSCRLGKDCKYTTPGQDRTDWANGFAAAVLLDQSGKVWWRSRTMQIGVGCLAVGVILLLLGEFGDSSSAAVRVGSGFGSYSSGNMMVGAGGALTLNSILNLFLRTITTDPVRWGGGGFPMSNP